MNKDKADLFRAVFTTPNGKKVYKELESELNRDSIFVKGDALETAYKLGQRDAFIYIKSFVEE
jgi:hypothetical protein